MLEGALRYCSVCLLLTKMRFKLLKMDWSGYATTDWSVGLTFRLNLMKLKGEQLHWLIVSSLCYRVYLAFLKINRWIYDPSRGIPIDTRNPQKTYDIEKRRLSDKQIEELELLESDLLVLRHRWGCRKRYWSQRCHTMCWRTCCASSLSRTF